MRKKKRKTNKFFKRFYVVSDNIKTNSEEGKKAKSSTEKLISSIRVLFSYPRLMLRESKSRIYLFTFRRPFRRAGKPARIRVPNSTSGIRKGNRLMDTHKRPSSARSLSISNFHFYLSLYQFQLFFSNNKSMKNLSGKREANTSYRSSCGWGGKSSKRKDTAHVYT